MVWRVYVIIKSMGDISLSSQDDKIKQKRDLDKSLAEGSIDGVEYNKQVINLMVEQKDESANIKRSSLRQSSVAGFTSVISIACAIIILVGEIDALLRPNDSYGWNAVLIFVLPIAFFCLLITAKMVDSMLIGAKTVSDSFERKLRKRRIAYTIAALSPFIIMLVFGGFLALFVRTN